jgi:hypothetical protein
MKSSYKITRLIMLAAAIAAPWGVLFAQAKKAAAGQKTEAAEKIPAETKPAPAPATETAPAAPPAVPAAKE